MQEKQTSPEAAPIAPAKVGQAALQGANEVAPDVAAFEEQGLGHEAAKRAAAVDRAMGALQQGDALAKKLLGRGHRQMR